MYAEVGGNCVLKHWKWEYGNCMEYIEMGVNYGFKVVGLGIHYHKKWQLSRFC